jgi:spore maturation protein A
MLNYLWAGMILVGVCYGAMTGNIAEVGAGALEATKEAVSLCITMLGAVAFWVGLMEIAKESGLIDKWQKGLKPLLKFLFPRLDMEGEAAGYIAANMIANILGLGWACTPAGLKAMEALEKVEKKRLGVDSLTCASKEMCTFLIMNISSLQLIPVNMIVYRGQYGSVEPSAIIAPAIVATMCSTVAGVVFAKMADVFVKDSRKENA